jgi:hypothetical protein
VDDLLDNRADDPMAHELQSWLTTSARFRTFAETYRDKIRKKLRQAVSPDARLGVRTELRVAALLLAERHLTLAYEAYGATRGGPDFTVSYRGEPAVNVEVTRLGRDPGAEHVAAVLLAKLRQLPPAAANLVVIAVSGLPVQEVDVAAAARLLRDRADRKEEAGFIRSGYDGSRGFYSRYLRLGAVAVLAEVAEPPPAAAWWTNRSARIPVPEATARACRRSLRAVDPSQIGTSGTRGGGTQIP